MCDCVRKKCPGGANPQGQEADGGLPGTGWEGKGSGCFMDEGFPFEVMKMSWN